MLTYVILRILKRAMAFPFNNNGFQCPNICLALNGKDTALENYFKAMVYLALKFYTTMDAHQVIHEKMKNKNEILEKVINLVICTVICYARRACTTAHKHTGNYNFQYYIKHVITRDQIM